LQKCTFWLLDVNYEVRDEDRKPELWMWGIDDEGRRVLIIDRSFLTYFYLVLDSEEDPEVVLERVEQQRGGLPFIVDLGLTQRKLFGEPVQVIKVSCQDPEIVQKYAGLLSKVKGVKKCLEDDMRFSMRYLVDNDVAPCSWHEIDVEKDQEHSEVQADLVYVAKSPPKRIEREDVPELRVVSFFPVYHTSKGTPKPERDPVAVISLVTNTGEQRRFIANAHDDKDLIRAFIEYVKRFDPDVIVGYETNRRHWQYLTDRAKKLGLNLFIDRANTLPHLSVYAHISITGRVSIDTLDLADELPEVKVKSLENIADFLGVKSVDEQIILDEIDFAAYWDDAGNRPQLLQFASEKAECILGIFSKMFGYAAELSRLVGLPLDQIGRAAVGFRTEWYLIREAYKSGELVPERVERPYVPYAGGMVLKPESGIHEDVAVLDFKSMYPNIMIEKNISPDTYVAPDEPQLPSEINVAPEVGHVFRKEPPGFYKRVLSDLIAARDEIRERMRVLASDSLEYRLLDARQKAVKVITNATYGYAGWIGARWFKKPVAEATTAWGRAAITSGIEMARNLGLEVIYGDTDSIFLRHDPQRVEILLKMIRERLGLEIKPEKVYTRIFFTEAKKRYCGLMPDGTLETVGLEVVRGDWANVAKNTQERVLELILKERTPAKAVDFVRSFVASLREHKVPYRDLVIWKTLTKPVGEYEVNAPHVEAARMLEKEGWTLAIGDKVGYVITKGSGRLFERVRPYAMASYEEVDAEYYVGNQVLPAALRVLSLFGVKKEDLLSPEPSEKAKTLAEVIGEDSCHSATSSNVSRCTLRGCLTTSETRAATRYFMFFSLAMSTSL